jgi:hypothetical protein
MSSEEATTLEAQGYDAEQATSAVRSLVATFRLGAEERKKRLAEESNRVKAEVAAEGLTPISAGRNSMTI